MKEKKKSYGKSSEKMEVFFIISVTGLSSPNTTRNDISGDDDGSIRRWNTTASI
jgi:hypothetical protein